MKKMIFTLMMIAGLALVATTAMATNEKTVYAGSTYNYELTGVRTANDATAVVTYSTGNVTITDPSSTWDITAGTGITLSFQAAFASSAVGGFFEVKITDDDSKCSNTIQYHIVVMPPPVYTLSISATPTETCQNGSGAEDELADKRGGESNTITYTITPVVENIIEGVTYEYTFAFQLPVNAVFTSLTSTNSNVDTYPNGRVTVSGTGIADVNQGESDVTIEVTFETMVGEQTQTITASLPDVTNTVNASLTINDGSNGGAGTVIAGKYPSPEDASFDVDILAVPDMGSF